jgi:hexosaminidase
MRRIWLALSSAVALGTTNHYAVATETVLPAASVVNIIPLPQQLQTSAGEFTLSAQTVIYASDVSALRTAQLLRQALQQTMGIQLSINHGKHGSAASSATNFIEILTPGIRAKPVNNTSQAERYRLDIDAKSIQIEAAEQGQFYALQSLLQLMPQVTQQVTPIAQQKTIALPAIHIQDEPRFSWRGMHLDVGRHMYTVDFIKKLLDQMAIYKLNTFHWHLTEDQGWRIEIKRYPKLTQIGAWRTETTKEKLVNPYTGDGEPYGGFYTQAQIKEVVAYAKAKHIMVVPEIELPGHSLAALAAYPELACTQGPFPVGTNWGVIEDIYCPTDKTFKFLENVLTEVMALFPSPYIHIGGDEAPKTRWKTSPIAQAVMKREGLKNEEELQSYFIRRVEKFINSKGKRIIGWDEILEGGLAPNATVMSWRGEEGGIAAAKEGHDVIMTPTSWCYFDAGQGPADQELWNAGGEISLEKVYSYNPLPQELNKQQQAHIRGVQANIWSEYLRDPKKLEYMVFPRLLAMAEVGWSAQEQRQFSNFEQRLRAHYPRLTQAGIAYRIPRPEGLDAIQLNGDQAVLKLSAPVAGSKMFVSLDGSQPGLQSSSYSQTLQFAASVAKPVKVKVLTVLSDGRQSAVQYATVPQVKK